MNPLVIMAMVQMAYKMLLGLYNLYKQIEGTQPVPILEDMLAKNDETEAKIQAEKERLGGSGFSGPSPPSEPPPSEHDLGGAGEGGEGGQPGGSVSGD